MKLEMDVSAWAADQFGACDLGDARRTARAVTLAAQFAANPSGSTPEQTESWGNCKAAYRLFDTDDVTFSALATPHWQRTRAQAQADRHYLLIGDTTVVSFDANRQIEGMGIVTGGKESGYLLHSSLMVDADSEEIFGLTGQTIYYRQRVPKGESHRERLQRDRESKIWGEVIQAVGLPPERVRFTHVFDRGADNFEVYCHCLLQRTDWVIRAAQLKRRVVVRGVSMQLRDHLRTLPVAGTYEVTVPANTNQPTRTAKVEVRFSPVGLPIPRDCGKFSRECGIKFITMNVVEVLEVNPPKGVKPLRWVLYTSHVTVHGFKDCYSISLAVLLLFRDGQ